MKLNYRYSFSPGEIIKTRDGKETFLEYVKEGEYNRKRKVVVRCRCGKEWEVQLGNILTGSTICCGKSPCRAIKTKPRDPEVGHKALLYVYKK